MAEYIYMQNMFLLDCKYMLMFMFMYLITVHLPDSYSFPVIMHVWLSVAPSLTTLLEVHNHADDLLHWSMATA